MRTTRSQSNRRAEETAAGAEEPASCSGRSNHGEGSLAASSKDAVGKLLDRVGAKKVSGAKGKQERRPQSSESKMDPVLRGCTGRNAEVGFVSRGGGAETSTHCDENEIDWEEGTIPVAECREGNSRDLIREVTVEFTNLPSAQRKASRRASAEDKELAELVHKVQLLCLLARGRLIDSACNSPLIQASLLSLVPSYLLKTVDVLKLKATMLGSLVNWFRDNFHVESHNGDTGSFKSNLAHALETRKGTAEEVAALSVALLRSLGVRTRFVSILDVASLKPDIDIPGTSNPATPRLDMRICSTATAVRSPDQTHSPYIERLSDTTNDDMAHEISQGGRHKKKGQATCKKNLVKDLTTTGRSDNGHSHASGSKTCSPIFDSCAPKSSEASKRKGDLEFDMQLEMALSATACGGNDSKLGSDADNLHDSSLYLAPPLKKMRNNKNEKSPVTAQCSSGSVWSRKIGPPLCWAEVYCSGETSGRWLHIDAANGIVDGEQKVEGAAASCRRPLKYVVAFAGNGAKDVTRRYCMHWYKIASQRINSQWWDMVLAPLKELESRETGASYMKNRHAEVPLHLEPDSNNMSEASSQECLISTKSSPHVGKANVVESNSRVSLEDMELEIRALTEPLPTNQLAYKNHHLYAIERWLTKYQVLHPKGPVLGYCSGHPVYPRSCVQTVQTKQKWLREGFQVRANEVPTKVVKRSKRFGNAQVSEPNNSEEDGETNETNIGLYGKWQLELLQLPCAVNGIVPKNEYGRVDVWSEKCLPPGTVHLRLPRVAAVARRLEIDYAPAFVGFEFRNGRSYPSYEGIVVCTEFRDVIMEAYEEEEEMRKAEEKKRNDAQALAMWYQLLSSMVTRQRLENSYAGTSSLHNPQDHPNDRKSDRSAAQVNTCGAAEHSRLNPQESVHHFRPVVTDDHEHEFSIENQIFDEESMVRTKRCLCGFSIQVEEL